MFKPTLQGEGE